MREEKPGYYRTCLGLMPEWYMRLQEERLSQEHERERRERWRKDMRRNLTPLDESLNDMYDCGY